MKIDRNAVEHNSDTIYKSKRVQMSSPIPIIVINTLKLLIFNVLCGLSIKIGRKCRSSHILYILKDFEKGI